MRSRLASERDRVRALIRPMRADVIAKSISSDAEMRSTIQEAIRFALNPLENFGIDDPPT